MFRIVGALVAAIAVLGVAAPAAGAAPARGRDSAYLTALWTKVLETPSADNPFGTGGPDTGCFKLGHAVAPFGPAGIPSCTVRPGTKIFVAASSFECSTFEGNGTTYAELLSCAVRSDVQAAPGVTLDGRPVTVSEVVTGPLAIVLPANNIFGLPEGSTGSSAAHGWVALLHPLPPGTHTIVITNGTTTITTTIVVAPR